MLDAGRKQLVRSCCMLFVCCVLLMMCQPFHTVTCFEVSA
jgi:hypothetical protein